MIHTVYDPGDHCHYEELKDKLTRHCDVCLKHRVFNGKVQMRLERDSAGLWDVCLACGHRKRIGV